MGSPVINLSKVKLPRTPSILAIAAATVITAMPTTATAQTGEEATEAGFGDIVVTARKRAEDLLKTPVAITAVNSEMLDKQGIASVADLSKSTPSMNLNNNNSGRNDRSFQQIIIRGFVPSNAQNPTTSTFIDGVPVSSPTAFNAISDPERIEVLRGPQSAYFGRNTFAGAMNVVSKEPGDEFAGSLTAMAGTRNNYRVQGSVEGPILDDALAFRISAGQHGKSGSYKNGILNETLGDQETRFASALIVAKPVDGLKIKAMGLYSQDRDGAPANGLISAYDVRGTDGSLLVKGQSNCSFTVNDTVNPYMCGTVRDLSLLPSANTALDTYAANFLSNPKGRLFPSLKDYGLARNYYHLHLNIDYEIGDSGFSVSSLTGMNREKYAQFSDTDNIGTTLIANLPIPIENGARLYYDNPFIVERTNADFSQEFRLAFDNGGPLQGTVGLSYLNNWTQGSNGGGNGPLAGGTHPGGVNNPTAVFVKTAGMARSRTKGAFFGLSYKFTPQFTINAEGRYQSDTLYAYAAPGGITLTNDVFVKAGTYKEGATLLEKTYNNFLPRVIAQYEFGREAMIYASWAKGVNPGQFNTGFLTRSELAIEEAAKVGIKVEASPETVTNYEVGVKGRVLDNNLNYSISAYFAQWRDQANLVTNQFFNPNTGLTEQLNGQVNAGSTDMKGVEIELGYRASDLVTIGASGSFNDSYIKKAVAPYVEALTGISDFRGKEVPFTSKWSASTNVEFHGDVKGHDDATWFARADYMFKSGVWSNQANIVKTPDVHKVNIRAGVSRGPVSIEAFVTNLFNNRAFTAIGDNWLTAGSFTTAGFGALSVGLPELRTAGVQTKFKF
jgi:iron complex outermembrane receptor protein